MSASLTPFPIFGYKKGLQNYQKPALLPDQAWSTLENEYVWRERLLKREGNQILGRLQRVFSGISYFESAASPWSFNILSVQGYVSAVTKANPGAVTTKYAHNLSTGDKVVFSNVGGMTQLNGNTYTITVTGTTTFTLGVNTSGYTTYTSGGSWMSNRSLSATEPNAQLNPGSFSMTISTVTVSDNGNGTLTSTDPTNTYGYINYATGAIILTTNIASSTATTISYGYFPSLPGMGIWQQDATTVNVQTTLWWDQKYAYTYASSSYQEYIPGTTWSGSDYQFFWAYNYQAGSGSRLLFVTNFNINDPMYYTNGSSWTPITPLVTATNVTNENDGTVTTPWSTFSGTLSSTPVLPGTVVIKVGSITFTDSVTQGVLTGNPSSNAGTVNYSTGSYTLNFSPSLSTNTSVLASYSTSASSFLFTARILIPYYGRLIALNTYEGSSAGSATNYFNRCRFSWIGDPTAANAFRSDIFGYGGFLDAPTQEEITGATFVKNTLVVDFEYSTWQLRYVGEYGLPFIWERVSADFGSGSTFSGVLFDNERLNVGDVAITAGSGAQVNRIDLDIPDQVFNFQNNQTNEGAARVWGIRNYEKELVYWNYPDSQTEAAAAVSIKFPNKVLLYNYRNKTWAIFRDNVTCFGTYQEQTATTWSSQTVTWSNQAVTWSDPLNQVGFPSIVKLNQQGFGHIYATQTQDDPSLSITAVALSSGNLLQLTITNHNLMQGEIIYLSGLQFVNSSNYDTETTSLNDTIYNVYEVVDANTIQIGYYNAEPDYSPLGTNADDYSFTPTLSSSIYVGGGVVSLFPRPSLITKDINLYQAKGMQTKLSRIEFLMEPQPNNTAVTVNIILNSAANLSANILLTPTNFSVQNNTTLSPGDAIDYTWFAFYQTLAAQYFRIQLTYSDALMNTLTTHQSNLTLYAINSWTRPGGRLVAGGS